MLYLNEAELPPVEGAVDGGDGGDGQEGEEPQAHDPKGEVHLHSPHLLLVPGVLHIGVDLQTTRREEEGREALANTDRSNQVHTIGSTDPDHRLKGRRLELRFDHTTERV